MVPLLRSTLTSLFLCGGRYLSNRHQGGAGLIRNQPKFARKMDICSLSAAVDSTTIEDDNAASHTDSSATNKPKTWLVVGDGDLSYAAGIADNLHVRGYRLLATVLEEQEVHHRVYEKSKQNTDSIQSISENQHQVKFGIDGTKLETFFPTEKFDCIEFNFPHWRGKTNARYNRQLVDNFLGSAKKVLRQDGEIRIAFCDGQGGIPADSIEEWRQSWMPAMYAAEHGLMLSYRESYEPNYGLSSHRGVDRPFFIGDNPQRYKFTFPKVVDTDVQLSCRHELRIMLHPDKIEDSPVSFGDIVHGDSVFELSKEFVPDGYRFEIPARDLLTPYDLKRPDHVQLAVFLLNYSGESRPLTRDAADKIRASIESEIKERWKLDIAKGGRLVSRPYPYSLLPKLIKEYNRNANAKNVD